MADVLNITQATFELFKVNARDPQRVLETLCQFRDAVFSTKPPSARRFASALKIGFSAYLQTDQNNIDPFTSKLFDAIYQVAAHLDQKPLKHPYHNNAHILTVA